MFCGSKKKNKSKNLPPAQIDLKDPNICVAHKQPYDSVCMESVWKQQRKLCSICRTSLNCKSISINDIKAMISRQESFDIIDLLKQKIPEKWDQEWRERIQESMKQIKNIIYQLEEDLLTGFLLKKENSQFLTPHDLNLMVDSHVIDEMAQLVNQIKSIENTEDDACIYLLAKMLQSPQESKKIIQSIESDTKLLKQQMQAVQNELQNKINSFQESLQSINRKFTQNQTEVKDPVFDFITKTEDTIQPQQLSKISFKDKLKISSKLTQDAEHLQVKAMIQLNESFIAYATNLNQIHIIKTPELFEIQTVEEDFDIYALGKGLIKGEVSLLSGVDDENGMGLISAWNLAHMNKLFTIKAHASTIWQIKQLPGNRVVTCSQDTCVKIFDLDERKEVINIQVHQATVNDVALVSTQLIASVSDDSMIALSDFTTGSMQGITLDDCEVKCVVGLNGSQFVTGNSNGFIKIYSIDKSQIQETNCIKVHDSMIRNISRITQRYLKHTIMTRIIVTSSWDGFHSFFLIDPPQPIKRVEGPIKNFTEAMLWVEKEMILLSGQNGKVAIYR